MTNFEVTQMEAGAISTPTKVSGKAHHNKRMRPDPAYGQADDAGRYAVFQKQN